MLCGVLAVAMVYTASVRARQIASQKAKVKGTAVSRNGYMLETVGYASSTGTKQLNQKLNEARAVTVAKYLRDRQNDPVRFWFPLVTVHSSRASNSDSQGRALNRRVDVKVLVNKGLNEG